MNPPVMVETMKRLLVISAFAACALPAVVLAQAAPADAAPTATPAAADAPLFSIWGFDLTGYIDVGYTGLSGRGAFNTTPNGPAVTIGGPDRVFDYRRNSLVLHQAAFTLAKLPEEGFGGLLNVTLGKDADVIAAYKTGPSRGDGCNLATGQSTSGSCRRTSYDFTQAFVQYSTGSVHAMLGKYVTLAGAEVINSTANPNYSRSILFGYAIPFTHTGLRVHYRASDTLTLMGGINNGWDNLNETNSTKAGEFGVSYLPMKELTLAGMVHFGKERVGGLVNTGPEGERNLFDFVATFNATDKLTFILNYDYATQANASSVTATGASTAKWSGLAGYANYQIDEQWRISLRGEYFNDRSGYRTGVAQKWKEATLTLGYTPIKNLELRGEIRGDRSNVPAFVKSDSVGASKSQRSVGLEAIYKF